MLEICVLSTPRGNKPQVASCPQAIAYPIIHIIMPSPILYPSDNIHTSMGLQNTLEQYLQIFEPRHWEYISKFNNNKKYETSRPPPRYAEQTLDT